VFYDKQGSKITQNKAMDLNEDSTYRVVGSTTLESGTVISTIWVGGEPTLEYFLCRCELHHETPSVPPLFETMVTRCNGVLAERRTYHTEAEAIAGHYQAVRAWGLLLD
jgi:hypothetical protein